MIKLELNKTLIIRIFVVVTMTIIVAVYYFSERMGFEFQGYDKNIDLIQRYNAELNESIIKTRFGIIQNYNAIDAALDALITIMNNLKNTVEHSSNDKIKNKLHALDKSVTLKTTLTYNFKRINPVLMNAINQFSRILGDMLNTKNIPTDAQNSAVTSELMQQLNDLMRITLVYTNLPTQQSYEKLTSLVTNVQKTAETIKSNAQTYPVVGVDFDKITLVLQYANKILALQPSMSAIDKALFEVPIIANLNELSDAFSSVAQNHLKRSSTYRIILYLLVFFLVIVLRWAFNQLQGMVTTLHIEIQNKIRAEEELAETNRQLEQRVADRTKELSVKNEHLNTALEDLKETQEQLIMQEKMASVGMLTTGIAHEIKNPLNFVNNFSDISVEMCSELQQVLAEHKDTIGATLLEETDEIVTTLKTNCEKIKEHGERADNIVKMMLLHSREAGTQKERTDLRILMDDSLQIEISTFTTTHESFEVIINKHYDDNIKPISVAPQSIGRVLIYILDNAFYAMAEKMKTAQAGYQPTLEITIQQETQHVLIKILDNGNGIPKTVIDKVFEPFFTTKPTGKGNTGLGLSICYDAIVKQHKGELKVVSEEGNYTEFSIILPRQKEDLG